MKLAALLCACLALVACRRDPTRCKESDGARCDGKDALVCIDEKWVPARCNAPCVTRGTSDVKCEPVEHPREGEACWESIADMNLRPLVYGACAEDGKAHMSCRAGERWKVTRRCDCHDGGLCAGE